MTEISGNEKAFIAISSEIRRLENNLVVIEAMRKMVQRVDQHSRSYLQEALTDRAYTEEVENWVKLLPFLIDDGGKLGSKVESTKNRLSELRALQEAYLKGRDIVAAKLSGVL